MRNATPIISNAPTTITETADHDESEKNLVMRRWPSLVRFWLLALVFLLFVGDGAADDSRRGRIYAQVEGFEFNYIAWELNALLEKAQQALFGFDTYASEADERELVIEYLLLTGQIIELEREIEMIFADTSVENPVEATSSQQYELNTLLDERQRLQFIVEPIIERHVATVLLAEGFGTMGQILPPVSFRFVETPDVLIVSPRHVIQQDYAISLQSLSTEERAVIEHNVETASPGDAAYVTGVGGVGIWPSMVIETRWAAIAYEVVAHEWAHHYLFAFPSGQQYLVRPETRFINETVATIFGNAMALKILDYYYADEVAQGLIWVPDYPTLQDFLPVNGAPIPRVDSIQGVNPATADYLRILGHSEAARRVLDTYRHIEQSSYFATLQNPDMIAFEQQAPGTAINRTRITTDYLLLLGRVEAAESLMDAQGQSLGMRVLNQAWFAFNGGYQAAPVSGAGVATGPVIRDVTDPAYVGDPIGPALHEIAALSPTLEDFLAAVRSVTTRDLLLQALLEARQRWGPLE